MEAFQRILIDQHIGKFSARAFNSKQMENIFCFIAHS